MLELIREMLSYQFMTRAIVAGGLISLCAALLGVYYIIWRFLTPESCLRFS